MGLQINSTSPLYLYSVQPEHYTKTCAVFNRARNVYWLNFEAEVSRSYIRPGSTMSRQTRSIGVIGRPCKVDSPARLNGQVTGRRGNRALGAALPTIVS